MAGRIVNLKKNQVYIKQWLEFHPYETATSHDTYYLKLCQEVRNIIAFEKHKQFTGYFDDDGISSLACFLVCYFEDVISGTRIWQSFTEEHKKLYGKYLPFYELEEYFSDEINIEDVFFLLWYFVSNMYDKEKIFLPVSPNVMRLGLDVFKVFHREFEYAPENNNLIHFFTLTAEENDFYKLRQKIEWLALYSYLYHFNGIDRDTEIFEMIEEKENEELFQENVNSYIYEITDFYTHNKSSTLLALKGKEWLANVIGPSNGFYTDIKNLGTKKHGFYLYMKEDKDNLYFQHIATNTEIPVTKKSMDSSPDFIEGESIVMISFIKWKNEWWFTGTYVIYPYDPNLILDEKNSISSRALFPGDSKQQTEILENQYSVFLKLLKKPIGFFNSKKELEFFMEKFYTNYNKSLGLSKNESQEAYKRVKKKGFLKSETNPEKVFEEFDDVPVIVFFNLKSGIEMYLGLYEFIPDPGNAMYNPKAKNDELLSLVFSDEYSPEFVKFLVEEYKLPGIKFPGEEENQNILLDNLDFMMRFWKRDKYHTKPQVTLI